MIGSIVTTAKAVVTQPSEFFRRMSKSGGFGEPLGFVVAMGVFAGLVGFLLTLLRLGYAPTPAAAAAAAVLTPIFAAAFSFVGAAVLFVTWRLLGSEEPYETAYRSAAYVSAITPLTTALGIVPYFGSVAALGWGLYLLAVASEAVHAISARKARLVFGVIFAALAAFSVASELTARRAQSELEALKKHAEEREEMTPEEAGRAVGEFLKGLQDSVDEGGPAND